MSTLKKFLQENKPELVKKGSFTTAYVYENKVILRSNDPIKECMAQGWFPDSELFPTIKFSDLESDNKEFRIYEMERFEISRSVKNKISDWDYNEIYRPLKNLTVDWDWINHYNWQDNFIQAINLSELPDSIKISLIEAYESCMNFSHEIRFEISPRNVSSKDGKLILRDCFFDYRKLKEVRSRKL